MAPSAVIYSSDPDITYIKVDPFPKPTKTTKLAWNALAAETAYHPYLIRCTDPTPAKYTFYFIDCYVGASTGKDVGQPHVVDIRDYSMVLPISPSTLPTAASIAAGNAYGFMFLTDNYIASDAQIGTDGIGSGGGTGKHPISAYYYATELQKARTVIAKLVEKAGGIAAIGELSPELKSTVTAAIDAAYF